MTSMVAQHGRTPSWNVTVKEKIESSNCVAYQSSIAYSFMFIETYYKCK